MRPAATALLLPLCLLAPGVARAAEQETQGMPQLAFGNPLTIAQVVWMLIIFAVLYVLLSRWALPLLSAVIDRREAAIRADLEAARDAKDQADAAVGELNAATRSAARGSQDAIARAVAEARARAAEQARALAEQLDARVREAEGRIEAARGAAIGALRDVANDTALALVDRLTGQAPPRERVDRAVAARLGSAGA